MSRIQISVTSRREYLCTLALIQLQNCEFHGHMMRVQYADTVVTFANDQVHACKPLF